MEFLAGALAHLGDHRGADAAAARAARSSARSCAGSTTPTAPAIVHRDLKPDNIMLVERDGRRDVVKILDFGIAKVTEPQSSRRGAHAGRRHLRDAGVPVARAGARRGRSTRAPTSTPPGVILYEMLAGRRPFESDDKVKIISMHLAHAPPRIRDVNPTVDVPVALEQVVLQALEKSRENRFATAQRLPPGAGGRRGAGDRGPRAGGPDGQRRHRASRGARRSGRRAARRSAALVRGRPARARWRRVLVGAVLVVGGLACSRPVTVARATPPRWSRRRPSPRPPPPTSPSASRRSRPARGRQPRLRPRAPSSRRCRAAPTTAACATCSGGWLRRRPPRRRRWRTTARRSPSTPVSGATPCCSAHVDTMLVETRRTPIQALDLVVDTHRRAGRRSPGRRWPTRAATSTRRHRAAAALDDIGQGKRVDRVSLGDARAPEGAAAATSERCWSRSCATWATPARCPPCAGCAAGASGPIRVGGSDMSCMKKELPEAIKALERARAPDAAESSEVKKKGAPERRRRAADGSPTPAHDKASPTTTRATCSPAWCWSSRCSSSTRSASCSRCRCSTAPTS